MTKTNGIPTNVWWQCDVCEQFVEGIGPWCDLFIMERRMLCKLVVIETLQDAQARGDSALVRSLSEYGRRRWGPHLFW